MDEAPRESRRRRDGVEGSLALLQLLAGERSDRSANLYSLIETAKANRIEPYQYLRALFAATLDDRLVLPVN